MPVIRENTFDGPDETAVNTTNSANHGDAFDTVDASGVNYDTDEFHEGTASVRLDDPNDSNGGAWQSLSLDDNAVRVYINRGTAESGNFLWNDDFGAISLGTGGDVDWPGTTLSGALPADTWCRVEFTRSGTSGTLSVWSSDPQSTGSPDATTTDTISDATITQWWFEHQGSAIWLDALAVSDDSAEIGPLVEAVQGTATTAPAYVSQVQNGGFETSITIDGGIPDGRFVVVYGTANDFDELVSVPSHWNQLRTDALPADRRTWTWWFIADGEPADYTVEWSGEHWHHLQITTWYNVNEVRVHDGNVTLSESTELDAPTLTAQNNEILVLFGFSPDVQTLAWSQSGTTTINESDRIIASYEHVDAGTTTAYTLTVASEAPLQATALLLHGIGGVRIGGSVTVAGRSASESVTGFIGIGGDIVGGKDVTDIADGVVEVGAFATGFKTFTSSATASAAVSEQIDGEKTALTSVEGFVHTDGMVDVHTVRTVDVTGDIPVVGIAHGTKSTEGAASGTIAVDGDISGSPVRLIPEIPILGLRVRLVAYAPNGDRLGELPQPISYEIGVPLNDMPSLKLDYPADAPNAHLLDDPCEVAIEVAPLDTWNYIEPHNCRFLRLRSQGDSATRTGVTSYTMPHYGWMLRKAANIDTTQLNEDDERVFEAATPGDIMATLIGEAQDRGALPGLDIAFTASADSSGNAWDMSVTIAFDLGQTMLSILESLADQGVYDWRFDGRTLQLYNPATTMNRDRRTRVVLHQERDVQESPNDTTLEELATRIFISGDGVHTVEENPSAITPWGEWEATIDQSGVDDEGTLTLLAQRRLEEVEQPRIEMTRKIAFPTTRYLPFLDYRPGDRITAPGPDRTNDEYQVRQITITSIDPYTVDGSLTLHDRFIEPGVQTKNKLDAILGGSGNSPGGSGQNASPSEDTRRPAAPTGLLLSTDTYISDTGEAHGQITATWTAVDTATGGSDMRIDAYEVWVRRFITGETLSLYTSVDDPDTTAFMSPFDVGQPYQVRVRAIGHNGRISGFSDSAEITPAPDAIPPNAPSTPVVSTRLGVLKVEWDGLTASGTSMPVDFDHVRVQMSSSPSSGFERIDTLYRAGSAVVPDQPYDEERYFRLIAVDRSENESDPSATASAATSQLVSTDVSPGSLGYELLEAGAVRDDILDDAAVTERSIAAGAVTAEKVRAYSITADRIAVGNTRNLLSDPNLQNSELNTVRLDLSNSGWEIESAADGQNAAVLDRGDVADGTYRFYYVQNSTVSALDEMNAGVQLDQDLGRVVARLFLTVTGMDSGSFSIIVYGRFLDVDGGTITNREITDPVDITDNGSGIEVISSNGGEIPDGAMSVVLYVRIVLTGTSATTRVEISRAFTATSNGTVLIEDGAVEANKIAANAVTADKITAGTIDAVHIAANAIQTDQLDADAITAKHTITGALIQTEASANRGIKIDSSGITGYDNDGNEILSFSSFSGDLTIIGDYRTGEVGENRIRISPDANAFGQPGLRMYSGSSGARDAQLFIDDGSGAANWNPWDTVLAGSEVTRNDTGRNDLVLGHGDGGYSYFRHQHGSYGLVGIEFEEYDMFIRGRFTSNQGSHDTFIWTWSQGFGSNIGTMIVTYGQAAPSGSGRMMIAVGYGRGIDDRNVPVTVRDQHRDTAEVTITDPTGSFRVNYLTFWVEDDVSGY